MKKTFREYLKILVEHEIVRRYVIINSFDGVLTVLGIVLAELFSNISDPKMVILPSVGAAIAMCVSGVWGAYSAERAEVRKSIRTMEAHLMKNLSGTEFQKKRENMAFIIGLVDGISPLVAGMVIIIPFFLAVMGAFPVMVAYYSSLAIAAVLLFMLGALAGRIARESLIKHGLIMLLAGIVIATIFILFHTAGVLR